jgi:hypothetical protein
MSIYFYRILDRIRMKIYDTRFLPWSRNAKYTGATTKKKVFVDLKEVLCPEVLLVQNVGGEELRSHASGKIFEGFSPETAFNGSVVAVGLGITLFK